MINYQLTNKLILVTGGSKGLGKAISFELAASGATVAVNFANDRLAAEQTVEAISRKDGKAFSVKGNVTDEREVAQLVGKIEAEAGDTVDVVVNNATGPQPELSIEESRWVDYQNQLDFFVKAPLLLLKAVLPGMKQKGAGRIITIGSEVVQLGNPNFANYVTAKSAQLGMTRSWANELGPFGITVNLVNPGFIPVERHADVEPSVLDSYAERVPLRKTGEPKDIANAVAFLASDGSKFINGQLVSVNGGNTFGI